MEKIILNQLSNENLDELVIASLHNLRGNTFEGQPTSNVFS